jgi:anti-sigma regulatory factor (Ser/Thr protein kinase)
MPTISDPAGSERLVYERALPAVPIAVGWMRRELDRVLERMGVGGERRHDVSLVLSEAAANVVVHAYSGTPPGLLYALAVVSGGDLRLDVFDAGEGMVPRATSPGLGVGLALMARLSDGLEIASNDSGGMQVSAVFRGVGGTPPSGGRSRAEELADYVDALRATASELQDDTRALRAQAETAISRARDLRTERRRGTIG